MRKAIFADFMWLFMLFAMVVAPGAEATAPRIGAGLFGEVQKVDIVGYQYSVVTKSGKNDDGLILDMVRAAFDASGKAPGIDILPSRNLAVHNLTSNAVGAMIGSPQDLNVKEKGRYHVVVFLFKSAEGKEEPVAMIFDKTHAAGLYQAFNKGLQKIIKNGVYRQVLEKYRGVGGATDDFMQRLKQHNPGWK